MVRSTVRGLLPNWLTPPGPAGLPAIGRHHGHGHAMLMSSGAGGETKAGGRATFAEPAGYLRSTQQPPPAINVTEQGERT